MSEQNIDIDELSKRVAIYYFPLEMLLDLISGRAAITNIPDDCYFTNQVEIDPETGLLMVFVCSMNYEKLSVGDPVPKIKAEVQLTAPIN